MADLKNCNPQFFRRRIPPGLPILRSKIGPVLNGISNCKTGPFLKGKQGKRDANRSEDKKIFTGSKGGI
jgi:hypothetical protein